MSTSNKRRIRRRMKTTSWLKQCWKALLDRKFGWSHPLYIKTKFDCDRAPKFSGSGSWNERVNERVHITRLLFSFLTPSIHGYFLKFSLFVWAATQLSTQQYQCTMMLNLEQTGSIWKQKLKITHSFQMATIGGKASIWYCSSNSLN